jgi:ferrous iron transport protein B
LETDNSASQKGANKKIKIALVGNPNSGKSSLFNELTGLHQKIANFPGVTVEKKKGNCKIYDSATGEPTFFEVTDLPGAYSLYPKSPDERIPFQVLCDPNDDSHPDLAIIVADATNLKRSLFIASQVIDLKIPSILVLNMMDQVKKLGINIHIEELERRLGVRVIPMNARDGIGLEEFKQAIIKKVYPTEKDIFETATLAPKILKEIREELTLNSDYAALQIAHHIESIDEFHLPNEKKIKLKQIVGAFNGNTIQSFETLERYKVIREILSIAVDPAKGEKKQSLSHKIDGVLMHRFWGYVCFLGILFLMFQAIFSLASFPMNFIDETFASFTAQMHQLLPKGVLNDLFVNGVLAGIGGIIIFIPQIALLFSFIAILEDTGYMARVSFLMDKLMRKFGLNGRSVIPLISGVACAVPAILSTRTIGSWKERLITILVTPLMSCSARLPVYTLLISLVVPQKMVLGIINLQALVMMSLYLIGFAGALGAAAFMQWFVKAKEKAYFIMEIPVYRMPRWSNVLYVILEKVRIFLFDAGKIIIAISIILWYLSSRGPGDTYQNIENEISILSSTDSTAESPLVYEKQAKLLESSYAGHMGHWIEPAIRPLGFDWKIGIALVTSFAAREVFVGTMSTIYSVGKDDNEGTTVREKMQEEINPNTGKPMYTVAVGWSLMIFYAFAMQCMSTMAVVRRETGGWKWPIIQFVLMGASAYLLSLVVYIMLS